MPPPHRRGHKLVVIAIDHSQPSEPEQHLELPVTELLDRARPLPERQEMIIDDLTPEEGQAFLSAVRS